MQPVIETPRLILRELTEDDAPGMYALDSDPEVLKYLGNKLVRSVEESLEIIKRVQQQYLENGIGRWAIIDKATQDFIGWSGLKYETAEQRGVRYYDLGYRLRRKYWGQGIATETAAAWLKYGFTVMNLPLINAAAHVDNAASNKILQKMGFEFLEVFEAYEASHNWYKLEQAKWVEK